MNYCLLKESRQELADELIARFSPDGRRVLFYQGPFLVAGENQGSAENTPFSLLQVSPFSVLVWQVVLLALFLCFWKWPIFGRPRTIPAAERTDFTDHLDAYGQLLKDAGAEQWAQERVREYLCSGMDREPTDSSS